MWLATFAVVTLQRWLPLNPDGIANMEPTLASNTISSFTTNTNLQHHSGETSLSCLSQMLAITFLQFVTAATGVAAAVATIRGLAGNCLKSLGSFYVDLTRATADLQLARLADRAPAAHRRRAAPGDRQGGRAGRLLVGQPVVHPVRDPGDPDHPRARRHRSPPLRVADLARDRRLAGDRHLRASRRCTPTRAAEESTSWRATTSASSPRRSPGRRC
jgi:hypothetical protein